MNKKAILLKKTPKLNTKKQGKVVVCEIIDNTLVIYYFNNKVLENIYCINKDEEKRATYCIKEKKWKGIKLLRAFGYDPAYDWSYTLDREVRFNNEKSKQMAEQYLEECNKYYTAFGIICRLEEEWDRDKRYIAYTRKRKRVDELMNLIPVIPDEVDEWVDTKIFSNRRYMFYLKERNIYTCTSCGTEHTGIYKHNQQVICPKTNKQVIVKKRQKGIVEKVNMGLIQRIDERQIVARYFIAEKWDSDTTSTLSLYEEIRIVTNGDKAKTYYGQVHRAIEDHQEWWETNYWQKRVKECFMYPDVSAIKNTIYEYIGIKEFVKEEKIIDYNELMCNARIIPFMEYLLKGNLKALAEDIINGLGYFSMECRLNEDFNQSGKNAAEVLKINAQRVARLRSFNGGMQALEWLQLEETTGSKIPQNTIQQFDAMNISPEDIKFISDKMNPTQVLNYLIKQKLSVYLEEKSYREILGTWKDYLDMAKQLGKDLDESLIYKCTNLGKRHFEAIEELNARDLEKAVAEKEKNYPDVRKNYQEIKGKYTYENNGYTIVEPAGIKEIMMDSRYLEHCAANAERYYDRISTHETYILFLRRTNSEEIPYVTLEVQPNGTVRQKRTKRDKEAPECVVDFIKEWQKVIQKRLTKEDKNRNKLSDELRISNMKKIKTEKPKLYKLLENDFLPVQQGKASNIWIYVREKECVNG